MRALTVLAAVALVAGCIQPGDLDPNRVLEDPSAPLDWALRALPFGKGHDHEDTTHHRGLSTPNFETLGWDPLVTDHTGTTAGGYLCGDATGNGERSLAVVHSLGGDVSFVLADVTDPANPAKLSEMTLGGTNARDVALTPDTSHVVVGASGYRAAWVVRQAPGPVELPVPEVTTVRSACSDAPIVSPAGYPSGVVLVDVADPTMPKVADYFPLPYGGTHSVGAFEVDGTTVVLASVLNLAVQPAGYFAFFTVEGGRLVLQSTWNSVPVSTDPPLVNYHNDGWIHKHPVTDQVIAYLADWDGGLVLLDVGDLKRPKFLARWTEYDSRLAQDDTGSMHSALVLDETWDGKHYTIVGQEILDHPADTPTGVLYVLDTTDPTMPNPVSAWTLPVDPDWEDHMLVFSTHYPEIVGRTMFVSMYHGGVWAVDLADPASPRTLGVFVPDRESPEPPPRNAPYRWAPTVMEVQALPGGEIVVWDSTSGVYTLRFHADRPAPAVEEWHVAT